MRVIEPYVLIKVDPEKKKLGSLLLINTADLVIPKFGTVHMVGEKKDNYKVKEGERVSYNKESGVPVNIDGVDYLYMREMDITAVIS